MHFIISCLIFVISLAGAGYIVSDYYPKGSDGLGGFFEVIVLGLIAVAALINIAISSYTDYKQRKNLVTPIIAILLLISGYFFYTNFVYVTSGDTVVEEISVEEISVE